MRLIFIFICLMAICTVRAEETAQTKDTTFDELTDLNKEEKDKVNKYITDYEPS